MNEPTGFDYRAVDRYQDELVRELGELLRIPSVIAAAEPGAPFGRPIGRALDYVLDLGTRLGFRTVNVDGYGGHAEYGNGGPVVGVLVHVDVVPAGDGWTHDPFGGEVVDGTIFGRGAADDKGPAIAALYCLRALADQVSDPPVRYRIIFGTDEETGWRGIPRYLESQGIPDLGFSPDANYPLYNREKGIVDLLIRGPRSGLRIIESMKAGNAYNMVPDSGVAVVAREFEDFVERTFPETRAARGPHTRISIRRLDGRLALESRGVSAHAGVPADGVNAASHLLSAVLDLASRLPGHRREPAEWSLEQWRRLVGFETKGESLGIGARDEASGDLSVNWGLCRVQADLMECGLNIRYPVTRTWSELEAIARDALEESGFSATVEHHLPPLFVEEDSPLVRTLLESYRRVTGEQAAPLSMAGGTYARVLANRGVAFGAGLPGEDTRAHRPDEFMSIESLMRHARISTQALFDLGRAATA